MTETEVTGFLDHLAIVTVPAKRTQLGFGWGLPLYRSAIRQP
jgi:hypothetical protein